MPRRHRFDVVIYAPDLRVRTMSRRRTGVIRKGAVIAAGLVFVGGCGGVDDDEVVIVEVVIGEDDQTVLVRLDAGGTEGEVSVDETGDEVHLTGSAPDECGASDDCAGPVVELELDAPLGDRRLILGGGEELTSIEHCADSPPEAIAETCEALASD